MINKKLARQLNLSKAEIVAIEKLQSERYHLVQLINQTTDFNLLRIIGHQIKEINYELQDFWRFPLNFWKQRFWELPKCTCPKWDNYDACAEYFWIDRRCPLHGN